MRLSDWTVRRGVRWHTLAHVQACVPSVSLLFFGVSASLRCLICPPRWLARSSTSSQTGHPCRSLMICRIQRCLQ